MNYDQQYYDTLIDAANFAYEQVVKFKLRNINTEHWEAKVEAYEFASAMFSATCLLTDRIIKTRKTKAQLEREKEEIIS